MKEETLVRVMNLVKLFPIKGEFSASLLFKEKKFVHAVDGIDFQIARGEVYGVSGESGCGKTTTGKLLALLEMATKGKIFFEGQDITCLNKGELKRFRRKVQMIFQDPYDSLDPRLTVYDAVVEPLNVHSIGSSKNEKLETVCDTLNYVRLTPPEKFLYKYPHQLSGGQRQRVNIARSMIARPEFLIADEPVSMLDVSIRAGILDLMVKLKKQFNLTYMFISHDISAARYICDRIAIMYLGRIVETGPTEKIIRSPIHPYTKLLLSAVPIPDPKYKRQRVQIPSEPPQRINLSNGCRFQSRCPYLKDICKREHPVLQQLEPEHFVACHLLGI